MIQFGAGSNGGSMIGTAGWHGDAVAAVHSL